jgi:hypothetical protein
MINGISFIKTTNPLLKGSGRAVLPAFLKFPKMMIPPLSFNAVGRSWQMLMLGYFTGYIQCCNVTNSVVPFFSFEFSLHWWVLQVCGATKKILKIFNIALHT